MLKKLYKCTEGYRFYTFITPILVIFEVILDVIIPLIMADIIDYGIKLSDIFYIVEKGILLFIISILALILGVLSGFTAAKASSGFSRNLRRNMFYNIQDFSFSNIDKFSIPSLITRLTSDVGYVRQSFQMIIRIAIRAPLMLIFSLIMSFRINNKISLIFLILIPYLAIMLYLISKKVHPIFTKTLKTYDKLNLVVEENIRGIKTVKSFVLEEFEKFKFNNISKKIYTNFSKAEKILALNNPVLQSAVYIAIIFISWVGAKIIVNTNATSLATGELTTLFSYTTLILSSLMMLSMVMVNIIISKSAALRIYEVLNEKTSIKEPVNPIYKVENGQIEFKNVGFSFINKFDKEVLTNVNLNIKSGEVIGIIGPIGCGKSSLVNLIPRLYDVKEGEVLIAGINVKDYDINTLRSEVSCVLQKNVLFKGTILENIKWGNENATYEEVIEASKIACAHEFIESFDLKYDTMISENGNNVSGGQKQRICIARAILKKPKILILDDSTSAVDTKTDKLIHEGLKKYIKDTTTIIISQRISSIIDADRIIVMNNGVIQDFAPHKELIKKNAIYKELYESQKGSV